jgi:hypothetical protein
MSREDVKYWQPPPEQADSKKRWGWVEDIISDGERNMQAQPWWSDLPKAEGLIRGKESLKADQNRSDLTSNRLKRIFREMVAAISDVRYPDNAWASENKAYADTGTMFGKVAKGVWYESRAPLSIRRMSQWMVLGGNGFLWPSWRRRVLVNPKSTALCFDDYGPRDVVPFMVPADNNIQGAYASTVIRMMPLPEAHGRFPLFADRLKPISKRRQQATAVSARMAFLESLRGKNSALPCSEQLCEIRYTMIRDLSYNSTDMPIPMGPPGASWSYVVPPYKADTPDMFVTGGERKMHQSDIDEARLYPNMRLMVTGSGVNEPLVDGPYWYWHGMMPPRFYADDWVTEQSGLSLIRDVLDLERCRQFTERAVDMKIKAQMDPGMKYDNTVINAGTAEELDPWEMRKRLGVDGDVEKAISTLLPEAFYKIGTEPFEWLKYLSAEQDEQLGASQMNALAKAKMAVSGGQGDMEDLLRMAGPIVRDISASMESPMADVFEMVKYDILQFMDTKRVMTYVGPDGVTPETFDFDPHNIVPSHMPGEDEGGASKFSRMERAKTFAANLRSQFYPGSVHGLPEMSRKLLLLQAARAGNLPISPKRVLREVYGIENFEQELKEWQDFRMLSIELAAKLKEEGASVMPPSQDGGTPAGSQHGTGGRPPSGTKNPTAKTKGSAEGPRSIVSQSG